MEFWVVPNVAGLPTISGERLGLETNLGKGALVSDNGQTITSGGSFKIITPYAFIDYDDLNFFDGTDAFIIPDIEPAIQRVQVWMNCGWEPQTTGSRMIQITKNGIDFDTTGGEGLPATIAGPFVSPIVSSDQGSNIISAPIPVVVGDVFRSIAKQTSGGSLSVDDPVFGIWIVR